MASGKSINDERITFRLRELEIEQQTMASTPQELVESPRRRVERADRRRERQTHVTRRAERGARHERDPGIVDFVPSDPKRGFYGGGRLTARGYETPLGMGLNGLSPDAPRWGAGYKKALREEANHKMTITCFTTQMPLETNRVDLDPDVKDEWGLPAMRITSTSHPNDMKCANFFHQKAIEILKAAGATKVWGNPPNDSRGGAHNRGSCRMGNDPRTSVVDKFHKAHDVPNLWVVDGSNLVTGGRNHPTMTIQALAFRAAEHLIKAAKTGILKQA